MLRKKRSTQTNGEKIEMKRSKQRGGERDRDDDNFSSNDGIFIHSSFIFCTLMTALLVLLSFVPNDVSVEFNTELFH